MYLKLHHNLHQLHHLKHHHHHHHHHHRQSKYKKIKWIFLSQNFFYLLNFIIFDNSFFFYKKMCVYIYSPTNRVTKDKDCNTVNDPCVASNRSLTPCGGSLNQPAQPVLEGTFSQTFGPESKYNACNFFFLKKKK